MDNDFAELRQALDEATKGEWQGGLHALHDGPYEGMEYVELEMGDTTLVGYSRVVNVRFAAIAHNQLPDLLAALDQARAEWDELAKRNHELHETVDNYAGHCETACKRADTAEAVLAELRADYAVLEGIRRDLMARCERMRSLEGLSLDEIAARQIAHDARLKRDGAAEWLENAAREGGYYERSSEGMLEEAKQLREGIV